MITQDEFAWYFIYFTPLLSVGNESGQHMRIQILILGFKGLNGLDCSSPSVMLRYTFYKNIEAEMCKILL